VIVDALLGKEPANARIFVAGEKRHAPVSIDAEVLHALRRKLVAQVITEEAASAVVKLYRRVTIDRHAVQPFIDRIWALRKNVTACDAATWHLRKHSRCRCSRETHGSRDPRGIPRALSPSSRTYRAYRTYRTYKFINPRNPRH
jgi:hypothetical protein